MYRQIEINPDRITNQEDMRQYMQQLFLFDDENAASTLDALQNSLTQITDEIDFILTPDVITRVCSNEYAYQVLLMLGRAGEINPGIHVHFRCG